MAFVQGYILKMGETYWTGKMWVRDRKHAKLYPSAEAAWCDVAPFGVEVEQCT